MITTHWPSVSGRDGSPGWEPSPNNMRAIRATFASPGVASAALAYYRCALANAAEAGKHTELQRRIGVEAVVVPCLYLHGDQDGCIGYAVASGMGRFVSQRPRSASPAGRWGFPPIWSDPTT